MTQLKRLGVTVVFVASVLASPQSGLTHGDVTPQAMETKGLLPLGEEWLSENPYRGNPLAIKIGEHGYTQNCARCHGTRGPFGGPCSRSARLGARCGRRRDLHREGPQGRRAQWGGPHAEIRGDPEPGGDVGNSQLARHQGHEIAASRSSDRDFRSASDGHANSMT